MRNRNDWDPQVVTWIYICSYLFVALAAIKIGHHYIPLQNALQKKLFELPSVTIDIWTLSHVIMYCFIGYMKPHNAFYFFIFGASFEVVEDYLASNSKTQLVNCYNNTNVFGSVIGWIWCHTHEGSYWYCKWDDLFFNLIGYTIGEFLSK